MTTIIPVYNRPAMLCKAVQSVLGQSWRPIEIVIVDDGSTDDTGAVADRLAREHPDVIRVLHVANGGPGWAREQGRRAARGEFVQYLDSDDWLLPGKFAGQVQALRNQPDCGVAYGKTRLVDEAGRVLQAPFKRTGERLDTLFPALLVDRWWNTHTPLYRRSLCNEVGGWSNMRMGEDWEYDARVGATGTRLAFCDQFVSDTCQHAQTRLTGAGKLSPGMLRDFGRLVPVLFRSTRAQIPLALMTL
ncbi:MAG: glycosyltransferase family 2 protein, partial [Maioricimonas sp. JB049]